MDRTLLIPTDFSNNALVATNYALKLAALLNAKVHILHCYTAFSSAFQNDNINKKDADQAKVVAENGMQEFLDKLSTENHTYQATISEGELVKSINKFILEKRVDLVIMGTHGTSENRRELMGSNTYMVAKDIEVPLLIVPEHSNEFSMEQILFFTDFQNNDCKVLECISALFGNTNPPCKLIHIAEEKVDDQKKKLENWMESLSTKTGYKGLTGAVVSQKEGLSVVNDAIEQYNASLCLLTLVEGRGFFEKLFHKSLARKIILNPKTPVLLTK